MLINWKQKENNRKKPDITRDSMRHISPRR
jgi:hypothetical protein